MSDLVNQHYLLNDQYRDAANLNARIQLHKRFSTSSENWLHWVFGQFEIASGSRILELGCGPGHLWQENLDRVAADWQIVLSDFSEGMLQEARNNLAGSPHSFFFRRIDAQTITFEDDAFDCVIADHMLYHVPDRARALSEIRRVLKPTGRFYAATNGEKHLKEMQELAQRVGFSPTGMMSTGASTFLLENGTEQMAPYFAHIEIRRWENSLSVTEAAPLIAFMLSNMPRSSVDEEKLQRLQAIVEQELAEKGAIAISKDTGLFVAYGPK